MGAPAHDAILQGLDPFDALDAECERLARHFASLDDFGWGRPSRCDGWRTREILSHFAGNEVYNLACLDDTVKPLLQEARANNVRGPDDFNAWMVRRFADQAHDALLERWIDDNAAVRKRLRERGADGSMTTMVGPYPVGWQVWHLATEYATHADDIDMPVPDEDRAHRADWRARAVIFILREAGREAEIEPAGAAYRVRVAGKELTLSPEDLTEAVMSRLPPERALDDDVQKILGYV